MVLDCKATCGISSPAKGVEFEAAPAGSALKESNEFVAQNDMFDAAASARTMVDLPSELRTYTTVKSHYCKGGNIPGSELPEAAADLCFTKCSIDPTLPGCSDMDTADSGASCLLKESDFRRRTCYNMFHGGLMCSDTLKYPQEAVAAAGVKPSAFAFP